VVTEPAPGLDVEYAHPLLAPPENVARVAQTLAPQLGGEDTVNIICGHGSKDVPGYNIPFLMLDDYLRKHHQRTCLATLDGAPGTGAAFENARQGKRVNFIPLLFVSSTHTTGDIMGEASASYVNQVGLPATLGDNLSRNASVLEMLAEGADRALKRFIR
jgi:cobalamin biosynthesis Co2+ chelatase CbiK